MSHRPIASVRSLLVIALLITSLSALMVGGASAAQNDRGLIDSTTYQSPQFGYTVTWDAPWEVRDRDVLTNPGGFDTITLRSIDGVVRVSGRADTYDPLTFLQDTIAIQVAGGAEVINLDTTAAVPTGELQIGEDRMRLDVISLPDAGAVALLSLRANELDYDIALENVQAGIQIAGSPIFTEGGAGPVTETTPAEPTQAAGGPTQAPIVSTPEVLGGGIDGNSYTSPTFGFSISWDPSAWTVPADAEYSEPDLDLLRLESANGGPITIVGWRAYNGNASTCLLGEQTYYNDPEAGISEWQVAIDADGNELTGQEEGRAWGVYTNLYTDPEGLSAEPTAYVDYIECVSLGDGESVVIFYTYAERDAYNDHINNVLPLIETLELQEAAPEPTEAVATEPAATEPVATEAIATEPIATEAPGTPVSGQTDLSSGDTVNGQTYGYSFTIPAGWQASESTLGAEVERTVLTNGTSTVAVEARALQVSTLSDCVANLAGEHEGQAEYGDLTLARTVSGDAFSGEDDFSAFANFTFTGPDGEPWAHFIECRWIVEGESVLVVIQDVPEELFGSERAARRQIQNSIQIGP